MDGYLQLWWYQVVQLAMRVGGIYGGPHACEVLLFRLHQEPPLQRACRREYNCSTWAAASCYAEARRSGRPLHRGATGVPRREGETERVADCSAACGMLTSRRVRHIRAPSWRPAIVDHREGAQRPGTPATSAFAGHNGTCSTGAASSVMGNIYKTGEVRHDSSTTQGGAVSIF